MLGNNRVQLLMGRMIMPGMTKVQMLMGIMPVFMLLFLGRLVLGRLTLLVKIMLMEIIFS